MRDIESVARDMELAAEAQRSMLPQTLPVVPGYSFWVYWKPAHTVGGDMYGFHTLPTGEILLLVADVAGKGLVAALGMASLVAMVPLALEQAGADLPRFLDVLNRTWRCDGRFVALVAVALDPVAHRLRVANAFHPTGLICRYDGTLENLCPREEAGTPLGVFEGFTYTSQVFEMLSGDAIVIASDGVTNAVNATAEEYGTSRLTQVLGRTEPQAKSLGEAVLVDVNAFTGELGFQDDVVIVCCSRTL